MKKNILWALCCCTAVVMVSTGCTRRSERKETPIQKAQRTAMEDAATKRVATEASLRSMSLPDLIRRMDQDAAAGREPFNSPAYREVTKNRKDQGPALLQSVRTARPSLITLLALRTVDPVAYGSLDVTIRRDALIGALAQSKSYNLWGLPHLYWEDAAKAIIELKGDAIAPLKALLTDTSPAPVWGSEEHREYEAYMYRRCDYALALILAIRGEGLKSLPTNPAERDKLIEQVQKQ